MGIYEEKLEGGEFDWFAQDNEGNIALFATAGAGNIPKPVIECYKEHELISEILESPNWGSSEVWMDYAALGFFVYDWKLNNGPYIKKCDPASKMDNELRTKILAIKDLPKLQLRFLEISEIHDVY